MRKTLKRASNGKMLEEPNGIKEFAEQIANELLEKYPHVDFWDLMSCFESSFRYYYHLAICRESCKKNGQ